MEAANDNTPRPPAFDARLMAYRPGMMKRAGDLTKTKEQRDDLVTDTIVRCLTNWRNFREEGGSFWNWIYWTMRGIVSNDQKCQRRLHVVEDPEGYFASCVAVPAVQFEHVALRNAVEFVSKTAEGRLLVRHAMGDDFGEIAAEKGVTKQRIHQIVDRERKRLVRLRKAA
jgi:RNA polymerase sigma factor (sigma-70 family)